MQNSMNSKSYFKGISYYVVVATFIFICACRKDVANSNCLDGSNYKITCTGNRFVGDSLYFSSNIPTCVKTQWIFRDGASSYDAAPKHVFSSVGSYMVIIIINGDSANLNGKNPYLIIQINTPYNPAQINTMAGLRFWNVYQDSLTLVSEQDTFKQYKDTFAVNVLNDSTIVVKSDTLKIEDGFKTNGVADAYVFSLGSPFDPLSWKILSYYYKQDSVVYSSHPYQGGIPPQGKYPGRTLGITTNYCSHK